MRFIWYLEKQLKKHSYFIFFFLIGLFFNLNITDQNVCKMQIKNYTAFTTAKTLKINPGMTVLQSDKTEKKLIRPRYYSTELGIREKLFVGVLTTHDQIDLRAIGVNKTMAHLVDKIKYFMTASNKYKTSHKLGNIVGFTDTREVLRPFHIVKYISDSFSQNYDYFFLMKDSSYLNAHTLKYIVNKISVSQDVYLGTRILDSSYCSLDAGILISNSVLMAMKENLDWCVKNSLSDNHSENLGRCIAHSIDLECQNEIQGQVLTSFHLKHYNISKYLKILSDNAVFNSASVVYPVSNNNDIYTLHAYHSCLSAMSAFSESGNIAKNILKMRLNLPENYKNLSWPIGHRAGNVPETRFDVSRHQYFNVSHKFFSSDYSNVRQLTESESEDVKNVLYAVIAKAQHDSKNMLKYRRFVNGYSVFDLSRGLDYIMDLGLKDLSTGKEIIKRYQINKPLGKVEILVMPYVTENVRITILVPIQEYEIPLVNNFIEMYKKEIMDHRQKTFLMFIMLYKSDSPSKGEDDVFYYVKNLALKTTRRYHSENNKIAWLSVRLPNNFDMDLQSNANLQFAVIDLALKKIGVESLVLVLNLHVDINMDFLNRVRMNTIIGTQMFSVIPFRMYDPTITETENRTDIHKTTGQFDAVEYFFMSFYGKDYVNARLQSEKTVPIVRMDKDIQTILDAKYQEYWNIYKLFLRFSSNIHCMRATEPGLKLKYYKRSVDSKHLFLGSKPQLAKYILTNDLSTL